MRLVIGKPVKEWKPLPIYFPSWTEERTICNSVSHSYLEKTPQGVIKSIVRLPRKLEFHYRAVREEMQTAEFENVINALEIRYYGNKENCNETQL